MIDSEYTELINKHLTNHVLNGFKPTGLLAVSLLDFYAYKPEGMVCEETLPLQGLDSIVVDKINGKIVEKITEFVFNERSLDKIESFNKSLVALTNDILEEHCMSLYVEDEKNDLFFRSIVGIHNISRHILKDFNLSSYVPLTDNTIDVGVRDKYVNIEKINIDISGGNSVMFIVFKTHIRIA